MCNLKKSAPIFILIQIQNKILEERLETKIYIVNGLKTICKIQIVNREPEEREAA